MNNRLGRASFKASGKRTFGVTESIQGKWTPNMFNSYPNATYEKVYHIPRPKMETVVKKGKIYAVLAGAIEAGLTISHGDDVLPEESRLKGAGAASDDNQ